MKICLQDSHVKYKKKQDTNTHTCAHTHKLAMNSELRDESWLFSGQLEAEQLWLPWRPTVNKSYDGGLLFKGESKTDWS